MDEQKKGYYRPSRFPLEKIPLGARSAGHYIVGRTYREIPVAKYFLQVFWCIEGRGCFLFNGKEMFLNPDEIAVYFPGDIHNLAAASERWEYRWWTMDGPMAATIASEFGIYHAGIYKAGKVPIPLFLELTEAISTNTPASERDAGCIAYRLLCCAADNNSMKGEGDSVIRAAVNKINRDWRNSQLSVESVADSLGLDRTVFSKRFHAEVGISPVKYITGVRVQNALSQLKYTHENISVIARKCGWNDPNYFARCIRRAVGSSPEDFRNS